MKYFAPILFLAILSACATVPPATPTPYPTNTPYPTSTPYPTPTPLHFSEAFLRDLYHRIEIDDTIPEAGKKPVISLIGQEPTYVFPDNPGIVLQYILDLPAGDDVVKKTSFLLIGTGVVIAKEHGIPLWGIEVVFLTSDKEPWFATASIPPFGADEFRLKPLHPDFIRKLQEAGVITPTPEPTY